MRLNLLILALLFSYVAGAAYEVRRLDLKLPTQNILKFEEIDNAALATDDEILDDHAGDTTGVDVTVTTFAAQPDVTRVLSVTPGGTTADVAAGNVVISGLNIYGQAITATIAITENQSTLISGVKAFLSVTSIVLPAEDSPYGATWDVGYTDKLGMLRCMDGDNLVWPTFAGVYEATRPTVTSDADEVEKNFFLLNSALDGASDIDIYYLENYRCSP